MADLWYLALTVAGFLACWVYLIGLDRLGARKEGRDERR